MHLPMPTDPVPPMEPEAWGKQQSPSRSIDVHAHLHAHACLYARKHERYLTHNIMTEPGMYDSGFRVDYVATQAMRKGYKHTTNEACNMNLHSHMCMHEVMRALA